MTKRKLAPRSTGLGDLIAAIADGMCCSIVGLSNTGKSALLRSACEPAARQRFLAQESRGSALFYVDCNLMLTMTEQGFYEATLRGVLVELGNIGAPQALIERIDALYNKIIEPTSAFVVPLSFNESVIALCEQLEQRVIFLFDEFDEPFAHLDGRVFLNLRALRDKYGPRLCFVTATEKPLAEERSDSETTEFSELFVGCTHFVGMLNADDARQMVQELARRDGATLAAEEITFIINQAGGHAGLLLAITTMLLRVSGGAPAELRAHNLALAKQLLERDATVRAECSRLWSQLTEDHQTALLHLLTESEPRSSESARQRLVEAGILVNAPPLAVFSPLFETFARRQFRAWLPPQSGVYIDVDSGEVWVDGRKSPTLTDLEYRLLLLLYGRMDKICDKYQVVESVWGQEFIDEVDDSRVEKLISRLRQKIEANPANPRYFQTVRGRGYRLLSS